ncbi:hypothetical protein B0H34DRAFT_703168 [Crassisporium funariophilum]|nr:hypothetical protein B0H34DRAFT_703168 [Crassisporium funariophilum]
MPPAVKFYNSLPNVDDAHKAFVHREILLKLVPIFAKHGNFGICLVHRHTVLEEGEMMVTRGPFTEPERIEDAYAYPHSWARCGTPFEYSSTSTPDLPQELLQDFQKIVVEASGGDNTVNGMSVLGICYAPECGTDIRGRILVEQTQGRTNIVEIVRVFEESELKNTIPTAWLPAKARRGEVPVGCRCRVVGGVHIQENCLTSYSREVRILKENEMELTRVDQNFNSA